MILMTFWWLHQHFSARYVADPKNDTAWGNGRRSRASPTGMTTDTAETPWGPYLSFRSVRRAEHSPLRRLERSRTTHFSCFFKLGRDSCHHAQCGYIWQARQHLSHTLAIHFKSLQRPISLKGEERHELPLIHSCGLILWSHSERLSIGTACLWNESHDIYSEIKMSQLKFSQVTHRGFLGISWILPISSNHLGMLQRINIITSEWVFSEELIMFWTSQFNQRFPLEAISQLIEH